MKKQNKTDQEIKVYGNAKTVENVKQAISDVAFAKNDPDPYYIKVWKAVKPKFLDTQKIGKPILMGSGGEGYKNDFIKARRSSHDISGMRLHYPLTADEAFKSNQKDLKGSPGLVQQLEDYYSGALKIPQNYFGQLDEERKRRNYIKQTVHNWKFKLHLKLNSK